MLSILSCEIRNKPTPAFVMMLCVAFNSLLRDQLFQKTAPKRTGRLAFNSLLRDQMFCCKRVSKGYIFQFSLARSDNRVDRQSSEYKISFNSLLRDQILNTPEVTAWADWTFNSLLRDQHGS